MLVTMRCHSKIPTAKPPVQLTGHRHGFLLSQKRYLGWIDYRKKTPVLPMLLDGDGEPGANRNIMTNFGEAGGRT